MIMSHIIHDAHYHDPSTAKYHDHDHWHDDDHSESNALMAVHMRNAADVYERP